MNSGKIRFYAFIRILYNVVNQDVVTTPNWIRVFTGWQKKNVIMASVTPSWTNYQYTLSAHKELLCIMKYIFLQKDAYVCTMRCIFYGCVHIEIWFWYRKCTATPFVCLFYQMWDSAVQEQNMVNRKGVKTTDVKKNIPSKMQ